MKFLIITAISFLLCACSHDEKNRDKRHMLFFCQAGKECKGVKVYENRDACEKGAKDDFAIFVVVTAYCSPEQDPKIR